MLRRGERRLARLVAEKQAGGSGLREREGVRVEVAGVVGVVAVEVEGASAGCARPMRRSTFAAAESIYSM